MRAGGEREWSDVGEADLHMSTGERLCLDQGAEKLVIVGGGVIGMEFASYFSHVGVEVHVVEMLPQILPLEDSEVVDVLAKDFKKNGIRVMTGTKATSVEDKSDRFAVSLEISGGEKSVLDRSISWTKESLAGSG